MQFAKVAAGAFLVLVIILFVIWCGLPVQRRSDRQAAPSATVRSMVKSCAVHGLRLCCSRSQPVTLHRRFYQINDWLLARLDHAWAKFALVFGAHLVALAQLQAISNFAVPKWGLLASEQL
jgi:hypothetical protein